MALAARVQAHETALETIADDQRDVRFSIKLPFKVDNYFCNRDDYGNRDAAEGVSIGIYQHEDPAYQAANQCIWILHVEMTAAARAKATPSKAAGIRFYGGVNMG